MPHIGTQVLDIWLMMDFYGMFEAEFVDVGLVGSLPPGGHTARHQELCDWTML
jgi:hypothetical protein